jgi:SAM-dependent methyltransferase
MTVHGDHVRANQEHWAANAPHYAAVAPRQWDSPPSWGIWSIPEETAHLLPDVTGLDVVELGCGTAYVSSWLLRRGARTVVGLDPTAAQLATARAMQQRASLPFPLVRADAEHPPFAGESFDLAISEYGAAIWCDPYRWIPEAARLLRPGGRLIFLGNAVLLMLCAPDEDDVPATDRLLRPQRAMHRFEWPDNTGIEFHIGHGDMIRLLRASGFDVEDLVELYPPEDATALYGFVDSEWAARWPSEEVWVARKRHLA